MIDEAAMLKAIALSDWFGGEARRVYSLFTENEVDRRDRELYEQIHRAGGSVGVRDLMRSSRSYPTAESSEAALARLAARGWGRWTPVPAGPKGGQPTRVFQLAETVDIDTTFDSPGIYEVVSAPMVPNVRGEDPEDIGEADAIENPAANVAEWGEV